MNDNSSLAWAVEWAHGIQDYWQLFKVFWQKKDCNFKAFLYSPHSKLTKSELDYLKSIPSAYHLLFEDPDKNRLVVLIKIPFLLCWSD